MPAALAPAPADPPVVTVRVTTRHPVRTRHDKTGPVVRVDHPDTVLALHHVDLGEPDLVPLAECEIEVVETR